MYVNWMPPVVPNGLITHYTVYCQKAVASNNNLTMLMLPPMSSSPTTFTGVVVGYSLNVTIRGLTPFTVYGCFVSANTTAGEGNFSIVVFQTTDEYSEF